MPDELTGAQVADTPDSTGTVTPQEGQGVETGDTPPVNPRYAGKKPEELYAILDERDRQLGRLGERIGKVDAIETELSFLREAIARRQEEPRYEPPQPKTPQREYDPLNPDAYFNEKLEATKQELLRGFQQFQAQNMARDAQSKFLRGRASAFGSDKDLYSGIEREVEQAVQKAAGTMHPDDLADPQTWKDVAFFIRYKRGELDKVVSKKSGMAPASMERPGGSRRQMPDDDDVPLSPEDLAMGREAGLNAEQTADLLRTELTRKRRRDMGYR
jgi:hypothetical protein